MISSWSGNPRADAMVRSTEGAFQARFETGQASKAAMASDPQIDKPMQLFSLVCFMLAGVYLVLASVSAAQTYKDLYVQFESMNTNGEITAVLLEVLWRYASDGATAAIIFIGVGWVVELVDQIRWGILPTGERETSVGRYRLHRLLKWARTPAFKAKSDQA
jgi:hypothetical protein